MNQDYASLMKLSRQAILLETIGDQLFWDEHVMMPSGDADLRSSQQGLIARLRHDTLSSCEIGELLGRIDNDVLTSDQRVNVYELAEEHKRAVSVPPSLSEEIESAKTPSAQAWVDARKQGDFSIFAPQLEKMVELQRRRADAINPNAHPYAVMLGDHEDSFTLAEVDAHFDTIRTRLVPLIQRASQKRPDTSFLNLEVDEATQYEFVRSLAQAVGYDFERGRLDMSPHPMTVAGRITTRFEGGLHEPIFSTLHEAGHGMYEQGLPLEHFGTPLGMSRSTSVHESQSRLWENHVGRSREFWNKYFPKMRELYAPILDGVDTTRWYDAINAVVPGTERLRADELTYSMHILLRTELERGLVEGTIKVSELPDLWNEKTHQYLGVTPANDSDGVLQDPHWAHGLFGYFPTYTLGSMMAAQLFAAIERDNPEVHNQVEQGEMLPIKQWLNEHIHSHGRRYSSRELFERATGTPPSPTEYIAYLERKFSPST